MSRHRSVQSTPDLYPPGMYVRATAACPTGISPNDVEECRRREPPPPAIRGKGHTHLSRIAGSRRTNLTFKSCRRTAWQRPYTLKSLCCGGCPMHRPHSMYHLAASHLHSCREGLRGSDGSVTLKLHSSTASLNNTCEKRHVEDT